MIGDHLVLHVLTHAFPSLRSPDLFGEVLDYLASDPKTQSILVYVEGIHKARNFMSALRRAARSKPVFVIKVGRHAAGSKAVMSHTGALVGADDVFDAAQIGRAHV